MPICSATRHSKDALGVCAVWKARVPHARVDILEKSAFREGHADAVAHDDVIQQSNVHDREGLLHALRDELIGLTRLGNA